MNYLEEVAMPNIKVEFKYRSKYTSRIALYDKTYNSLLEAIEDINNASNDVNINLVDVVVLFANDIDGSYELLTEFYKIAR